MPEGVGVVVHGREEAVVDGVEDAPGEAAKEGEIFRSRRRHATVELPARLASVMGRVMSSRWTKARAIPIRGQSNESASGRRVECPPSLTE